MRSLIIALLLLSGCAEKLPEINVHEVGNTAVVGWSSTGASAQALQAITSQVEFALNTPLWHQYEDHGDGSLSAIKSVALLNDEARVWNVGAFQTIDTFHKKGKLDTGIDGYELFSIWRDVPVLSVSPDSPYKIIKQLTNAMLKESRVFKVATSGAGSAGDTAMRAYAKATGLKEGVNFEFVEYKSGTEAALAVASGGDGAPDIVTQNMSEQSDLISYHNLRPLMIFNPEAVYFKMAEGGKMIIQPFNHRYNGNTLEFGVTFGVSIPKPTTDKGRLNIARLRSKWKTMNVDIRAGELGVIPFMVSGDEALQAVRQEIEAVEWAND